MNLNQGLQNTEAHAFNQCAILPSVTAGSTALVLPRNRRLTKAELHCVVLCLPFSCCLSTTLLGKHLWRRRVVVKRRRWQSSHLLLAEFARLGIYATLMRGCACAQNCTQPCIVGMRAHMVELHYSKLNQCWRRSEMGGKMRTLAPLEAYKMPGSLHARIHLLHKIPVRYVVFLPLYSWSVQDRLRNLSKFVEFIHNRAIIWYLGCIFSNPPRFLLYFSACPARRVIRMIENMADRSGAVDSW